MSRVALVTGGSGGIGGAISRRLAEEGWTVLVGYRSDRDGAEKVVADLGGDAEAVQVDVTDEDTLSAAMDRAKELGGLGLLVNNAGSTHDDLLLRLTRDQIEQTLAVDLTGAMLAAKAAVRPMLRARGGRIVNVSSIVGLRGNPGQTAYGAAKAGLIGFTKSLARELARKGITVNVVAPGYVETAMTEALPEEAREQLRDMAPTGKAVTPAQVAAAVAFLASEDAAAVTGAVLPVDGGAAM